MQAAPAAPGPGRGGVGGVMVVTNVVFVVDTSASMNQRIYNGLSLLDCAKAAVEHFLKVRGRDLRFDRLFLLTFDEGPGGVKVGWGNDSFMKFTEEVKNLVATDLSAVGSALKRAFDLLNQIRFNSGFDNYGLGRIPWLPEPSVVILLTDGGALTSHTGVLNNLVLPPTAQPGSEFTIEPFRWDQRLFSILLRPPSTPLPETNAAGGNSADTPLTGPSSHLTAMSEVTGGKCYIATCMKTLLGCVESVVGRLNPSGLVVNFDRLSIPDDPPPGFQIPASPHRLLFIRPTEGRLPPGNWPLPESFPPEAIMNLSPEQPMPARVAHPLILVREAETEGYIYPNFPFDEYEVEPCPLASVLVTQLAQSKTGQVCCQVYSPNSVGGGVGEPFGYIKAARSRKTGHKTVTLVVLPYNYPKLWPLLDELINTHRGMPNHKWRKEFDNYLSRVPPYYYPYLRAALKRFNFPLPEHIEDGYTLVITNHLQKIKLIAQQKHEADRIRTRTNRSISVTGGPSDPDRGIEGQSNGGPWWNIGRGGLLSHLKKLQARLVFGRENGKEVEDEQSHAVPIAQMGNYHEILRNQLRPLEEDPKRRAVFFGNPFVIARADKAGKMGTMIDALDLEAAENEAAGAGAGGPGALPLRSKKRKPMPPMKGQPQNAAITKKPKLATPTPAQLATAVGPPPAGAIAPPTDEQTPSQAAIVDASAAQLDVEPSASTPSIDESNLPSQEPTPDADTMSGEMALEAEEEDEEDEEDIEEGELESDALQEAAESEPEQYDGTRPSTIDEEEVEEEGDEGEPENEDVESDTSMAAEEVESDSLRLHKIFQHQPLPRYLRANSARREALVSLIRQRKIDEDAIVRLVNEMEGPADERRKHASFALTLAQRWKQHALSERLLPLLSS